MLFLLDEAKKPDFKECLCVKMTSEIHDVIPATHSLESRWRHNKLWKEIPAKRQKIKKYGEKDMFWTIMINIHFLFS